MHLTLTEDFSKKGFNINLGCYSCWRCTINDQVENILCTFDNSCFCE